MGDAAGDLAIKAAGRRVRPNFIEHRKRGEQALIRVIQEAVLEGVPTWKIEAVLEQFAIAGVSAGQVSQLCAALDDKVRQFRERLLGQSRYVWAVKAKGRK